MFCKKSLLALLLILACPACGRLNETTTPESEGIPSPAIEVSNGEAADEQTDSLMERTDENESFDPGCEPMDESEATGEATQATTEGPVLSNPWGDGAPDGHTYTGGPGGGSRGGCADPRNYHQGSSVEDVKREHDADRRYWQGKKKKEEIQKAFARYHEEALTGSRRAIGGGGTVNHNACTWTCEATIAEACQSIQALCAGSRVIVLSPYVSVSCGAAILTACFLGTVYSSEFCDSLVCGGVQ
jgi:hypothetical protein